MLRWALLVRELKKWECLIMTGRGLKMKSKMARR